MFDMNFITDMRKLKDVWNSKRVALFVFVICVFADQIFCTNFNSWFITGFVFPLFIGLMIGFLTKKVALKPLTEKR